MLCTKCGTENADGVKFCTSCGMSMEPSVPVSTPNASVKKQMRSKSPFIIGVAIALAVVILGIILIPKFTGGSNAFVKSKSGSGLAFNMSVDKFISSYNAAVTQYLKELGAEGMEDVYREGGMFLPEKSELSYFEPNALNEATYVKSTPGNDYNGYIRSSLLITSCDEKVVSASVSFGYSNLLDADTGAQHAAFTEVAIMLKVLTSSDDTKNYTTEDWYNKVCAWYDDAVQSETNPNTKWENNVRYTFDISLDTDDISFDIRAMTKDTYSSSWS